MTIRSFSNKERAKLIIIDDKLYFHHTITINYTTYDCQRESETLNPWTHANVMTLSQGDTHPYEYSRILGILQVKVLHPSLGSGSWEVDILWVRHYKFDKKYQVGWKAQQFYGFTLRTMPGGMHSVSSILKTFCVAHISFLGSDTVAPKHSSRDQSQGGRAKTTRIGCIIT